jgi:hypothetical protein
MAKADADPERHQTKQKLQRSAKLQAPSFGPNRAATEAVHFSESSIFRAVGNAQLSAGSREISVTLPEEKLSFIG